MNIDQLIRDFKKPKIGNPISAVSIGSLETDILQSVVNDIMQAYDLVDEKYSTKESVFLDTRRIVARTPEIKTSRQLYTMLNFDENLLSIISPLIKDVTKFITGVAPTLVQIATMLPGQKLSWHADTFLYQQFSNKIHIPLTTNYNAFYDVFTNGEFIRKHLSYGSAWNINNMDIHRSINDGVTPRSHLIIDFIDEGVLDVLNTSGINYFHHRLPYMSAIEKSQITELIHYNSLPR